MNENLVLCCFATKMNAGGYNMIQTLRLHNWNYQIIGMGQKWAGWTTRMQAYIDFARQQEDPRTIIIFVDCYDVLTLRGPAGFIEDFLSFDADIVISASEMCSPWNCLTTKQYWKDIKKLPIDTNYKYTNGGYLCGRAFALAEMYDWGLKNGHTDDQRFLGAYINAFPNLRIKLDSDKVLAFNDSTDTLLKKPGFAMVNNKVQITANNRVITPYFVHFPGFLVFPTLHFFAKSPKRSQLGNYNFVAQNLLKNEFMQIGQVDGRANTGRIVTFWILIALIILLSLLLIFSSGLHHKRNREYKSKKMY